MRLSMNHFIEIRSYNLKPGTRHEFHRLFIKQAFPMLQRRDVDTREALCGSPDDRITLAEDHGAALLDLLIGEEGVQSIETMPEIHDQELSRAIGFGMSVMRHGNIDHVTNITKGFCSDDTVRVAGGHVVDFARFLQCGRR